MAEPFLSEIRMMSFSFPPKGWALCNGQLLPINQNQALFSLLGTTYGGDGRTNFALPNLQGRTPIHVSASHVLGELGGEEGHVLIASELPVHKHTFKASPAAGDTASPADKALASVDTEYGAVSRMTALHPSTISPVGNSQPHENMQPFIVLSFIIALQGIFPSQN